MVTIRSPCCGAVRCRTVWSQLVKICHVFSQNCISRFKKSLVLAPESDIKLTRLSVYISLPHIMAVRTAGVYRNHCHPMYKLTLPASWLITRAGMWLRINVKSSTARAVNIKWHHCWPWYCFIRAMLSSRDQTTSATARSCPTATTRCPA